MLKNFEAVSAHVDEVFNDVKDEFNCDLEDVLSKDGILNNCFSTKDSIIDYAYAYSEDDNEDGYLEFLNNVKSELRTLAEKY